jgi:hypothetical protein
MTTPDTVLYMWLGYGVIFGVMGLYLLRLWWAARRLRRQEAELRRLLADESSPVSSSGTIGQG